MDDFQFLIYRSAEEDATVKAVIKDDTIWLTISQMALLFDKEESNLRRHIKNIFDDGELSAENSVQKMHVDGVKQPVAFYNLDVIISVGYRVNSRRATHFRIWATGILKEYMTKGFVLDDERLKQGKDAFGFVQPYPKDRIGLRQSLKATGSVTRAAHTPTHASLFSTAKPHPLRRRFRAGGGVCFMALFLLI